MGESRYFMDYKMNELNDKIGAYAACDYICQASKEQLDNFFAFTKEDLKPGMVVQHRNGEFSMVMPSDTELILVNENRYIRLCGYTDNLCCFEDDIDIDIMNVYGFNENYQDALKIVLDGRKLLWERKEPKKMTVAEIKKLVEKITGEKIEVVDRIRKDRITIGESVFTDIDEALEYLKKLSSLKQFK